MNFLEWIKFHIDLIICLSAFLIFFVILAIYLVKIFKAKKYIKENCFEETLREKEKISQEEFEKNKLRVKNLKPDPKYIASLVFAFVLIFLPIFIPLERIILIVICSCGILAELIVLKDRFESLK